MKTTYIQPSIIEVRLQHHGIICTSTNPDGYDGQGIGVSGGTGNQIGGEDGVWTKEFGSLWDDEW